MHSLSFHQESPPTSQCTHLMRHSEELGGSPWGDHRSHSPFLLLFVGSVKTELTLTFLTADDCSLLLLTPDDYSQWFLSCSPAKVTAEKPTVVLTKLSRCCKSLALLPSVFQPTWITYISSRTLAAKVSEI